MMIDDTEYKFEGSMDYDIQKRFDKSQLPTTKVMGL